jgi:hypothetical protein
MAAPDVLALLRSGELLAAARSRAAGAGEAQHAERVLNRLQQLEYGRNTLGYQAYRLRLPRAKRRREDPATPLATDDRSKRSFGEAVKIWRRALHRHFPVGGSGSGSGGGGGGGGAGAAGAAAPVAGPAAAAEGEEVEGESVVRLADGRVCARVLPGTHAGAGGALPALLRLVYGGCRREAVGAAAERAAAGREAWEAAAALGAGSGSSSSSSSSSAPLPRLALLAPADLAPGPQGPAAGFTAWDEGAAGEAEAQWRAWQFVLGGGGGGGGGGGAGAAQGAPLSQQQVQALTERAQALQPTCKASR